jgi:hypothetical protein
VVSAICSVGCCWRRADLLSQLMSSLRMPASTFTTPHRYHLRTNHSQTSLYILLPLLGVPITRRYRIFPTCTLSICRFQHPQQTPFQPPLPSTSVHTKPLQITAISCRKDHIIPLLLYRRIPRNCIAGRRRKYGRCG